MSAHGGVVAMLAEEHGGKEKEKSRGGEARKERGGRKRVGERILSLHVQFPSSAASFTRESGRRRRTSRLRAGRLGELAGSIRGGDWERPGRPSRYRHPTHPVITGPSPAHFPVWPWSLAPCSFFIHINVEVSSYRVGVSVLQVAALYF